MKRKTHVGRGTRDKLCFTVTGLIWLVGAGAIAYLNVFVLDEPFIAELGVAILAAVVMFWVGIGAGELVDTWLAKTNPPSPQRFSWGGVVSGSLHTSTTVLSWPTMTFTPDYPETPKWKPEDVEQEEPIIAWRRWDHNNGTLYGMTESPWPGRFYAAGCHDHPPPDWSCRCGVNACKEEGIFGRLGFPLPGSVYGRVELMGTVHEYEHAYRASHANIIELIYITEGHGQRTEEVEALSQKYGVPVYERESQEFINQIETIGEVDGRW